MNFKYIEKATWAKMEPEDQIALIKQCTFENVELEVLELPKLNLDNIGHLFNQFNLNPKLVRIALLSEPYNFTEERTKRLIDALHSIKDCLAIKDSTITNLTITPLDTFNILDHYEITKTKVKERNRMERDTSSLTIKRLFNIHYRVNISKVLEYYDDSHHIAHQSMHRIRLKRGEESIGIGCSRYSILDLEQLAVQLGYNGKLFDVSDFPD